MTDWILPTVVGLGAVLLAGYIGYLLGRSGIFEDHEFWRGE